MRRLIPDPIPDEMLKQIVDAGVYAPCGSNFQSWAFLRVKKKRFIRGRYIHVYEELARRGSIPAMADLPPVILLACSGTEFPTYTGTNNPRAITATLQASILSRGAKYFPSLPSLKLRCNADDGALLLREGAETETRCSGRRRGHCPAAARIS